MSLLTLYAPIEGFVLPLAEVPDPVFSQGLAGDGVAIDPTGEVLHAPCDGDVALLPAGRHALTLRARGAGGLEAAGREAEILMHVGIDTVRLAGRGFEPLVQDGARVAAGQPLLRFNLDAIARGASSAVTPVLLAGPAGAAVERRVSGRPVAVGEWLMRVRLADDEPAAAAPPREQEVLHRTLTVPFDHGLHARPAALIAGRLRGLSVTARFAAHGRSADAASPVGLMTLGLRQGDSVEVQVSGRDAAAALSALMQLMPLPVAPAVPPVRTDVAGPGGMAEQQPLAPHAAAGADPVQCGPRTLRGVSAARGFVAGVAVPLVEREPEVPRDGAGRDLERRQLSAALDAVRARLQGLMLMATGPGREILEAHLLLLEDPELARLTLQSIEAGRSAAFGFRQATQAMAQVLAALPEPLLRERAADLRDLARQVVAVLLGREVAPQDLPDGAVVVAQEILPSQLIGLDAARLAGLVMAGGGPTSHVAIMAAAKGIPALVAVGPAVLQLARGTPLILDADAAELRVDPPPAALAAAQARIAAEAARRAADAQHACEPAVTADGVRVAVYCNAGSAAEAATAVASGAEGCGLLRTEFLFLDRREPPDEAEQAAAYESVAQALEGRPLTIRTLDAGGDKPLAYLSLPHEDNPALGLRGLRTSLWQPVLLEVQLRAIVRAADRHPCRILLPMVTELADVRAVRTALAAARAAVGPGPLPAVGVMIETPASAVLADQLCTEVEFLSIGTNDLSQYTLAMDRTHPALGHRLSALHPAVLRLIESTCDAAHACQRETAVCGALASDPLAAPLLLGLGVRELSCVPAVIPRIKALLRRVSLGDCRQLAQAALRLADAAQVRALARRWQVERGLRQEDEA